MTNDKPSRYPPEDPEAREFKVFPDMVGRFTRRGRAMVADNATVVGDVHLGEDVGVWFGVTIRGDDASITIGAQTNVQDNRGASPRVQISHRAATARAPVSLVISQGIFTPCSTRMYAPMDGSSTKRSTPSPSVSANTVDGPYST